MNYFTNAICTFRAHCDGVASDSKHVRSVHLASLEFSLSMAFKAKVNNSHNEQVKMTETINKEIYSNGKRTSKTVP